MAKTITLRLDDDTYSLIKNAAKGDRRSISNYIEFATMTYLTEETFISDSEMAEILNDVELTKSLDQGRAEIEKGKYRIVQ